MTRSWSPIGLGCWAVLAAATGARLTSLTLIDLLIVLGVLVVLPLAIGGRPVWWVASGWAATVGLTAHPGWRAGLFIAPWVVTAALVTVGTAARSGPWQAWRLDQVTAVLAAAFSVVAALALLQSRLGRTAFGVNEPIVELTAAHFTFAGAAALSLARRNWLSSPGRLSLVALAATAAAPPVVALGFVSRAAVFQVGGALVMTVGVWLTGWLHLRVARRPPREKGARAVRTLFAISGAAIWVPMVLAVDWAIGQHWPVPALSIPTMVRVHGLTNAIGFTLCGLLGHRLAEPDRAPLPPVAPIAPAPA